MVFFFKLDEIATEEKLSSQKHMRQGMSALRDERATAVSERKSELHARASEGLSGAQLLTTDEWEKLSS